MHQKMYNTQNETICLTSSAQVHMLFKHVRTRFMYNLHLYIHIPIYIYIYVIVYIRVHI